MQNYYCSGKHVENIYWKKINDKLDTVKIILALSNFNLMYTVCNIVYSIAWSCVFRVHIAHYRCHRLASHKSNEYLSEQFLPLSPATLFKIVEANFNIHEFSTGSVQQFPLSIN